MLPGGLPPTPGPDVRSIGVAFRYVSATPCDFDPVPAPPANVAVGRPPAEAGSGPCELPLLQWQVGLLPPLH